MTLNDAFMLIGLLTPIMLGILTYVGVRGTTAATQAAAAAQEGVLAAGRNAVATRDALGSVQDTQTANSDKLETIHVLVNSQMSEALEKISELQRQLTDALGKTDRLEHELNAMKSERDVQG